VYRELPPAKRVHVDALPHNRVPFVLVHPSQAEVAEAARARTPAAAASPAPTDLSFSPSRFVGTIRAPAEPAPGASPRPARARAPPGWRVLATCLARQVAQARASRARPEGPRRVRRLVDRVSRARFADGARAGRARAAPQPLACRRAALASPRSGGGHARRRSASRAAAARGRGGAARARGGRARVGGGRGAAHRGGVATRARRRRRGGLGERGASWVVRRRLWAHPRRRPRAGRGSAATAGAAARPRPARHGRRGEHRLHHAPRTGGAAVRGRAPPRAPARPRPSHRGCPRVRRPARPPGVGRRLALSPAAEARSPARPGIAA